jgi:hypothetical protein
LKKDSLKVVAVMTGAQLSRGFLGRPGDGVRFGCFCLAHRRSREAAVVLNSLAGKVQKIP